MSEEQRKNLEQQLWKIANDLRGKMNADEFRDYILGFIFFKYLSDKMHIYADKILAGDGITYLSLSDKDAKGKEYLAAVKDEALSELGYFLKPNELFSEISKKGNADKEGEDNFILEDLETIFKNVSNSTLGTDSEEDFENLFEEVDLSSAKLGKTNKDKNKLIAKILFHLDAIDFNLEDNEGDVIGDAYEYLIGKFASGAGKTAGEFYTSQQVSKVLAKIVTTDKKKLKSVYDFSVGSGSLLLRVAKEVEDVSEFVGQESNPTTYNLCRMNMILHGVHYSKFDIQHEDTLEKPQHLDRRFDAIVANPPFSHDWSANPLHLDDDRFSASGKLAPKSAADYAFVQHGIHQLEDDGTMAIILPHGALFRGGAEGVIRQYLIEEKNYLDAVIGLPSNIFFGTSIPVCIMVFKKNRETNDVLFIDASSGFEKVGNKNQLREEDIDKIVSTYRNRTVEEKYSYLATKKDIAEENEFNLNIPRYVDTFEEEEPVDLDLVANSLTDLEQEIKSTENKIADFCKQLNIKTPF